MDNLKGQAKKAFAWDFVGRMANQGVSFVIAVILARILGPEEFGLLSMIMVIIAFSNVFVDMGLGVSLIQRKEINDYHLGSVFWFNVFVGLILTIILYLSAPLVARFYKQEILIDLVKALSFLFIINAFGRVVNARLTKALDFKKPIIAQLLAAVISGSIGIFFAYYGYGVWALVVQTLLGAILNNTLLILLARFKPIFIFRWSALKELWGFGMRMFLSGMINSLYQNLDAIIIGRVFEPASLGFYNRAKNTKNLIISNATGSLNKIILPSLSTVQNEEERFKRGVNQALQLSSFVALLFLGLFFVIANDFMIILLTDKWAPSVPLFRLILLSAYSYPISVILVNIIVAKGNSKNFLRLEIYKKSIHTVNFAIGFLFGIEGFIIGLFGVSIAEVCLNIFYATKDINISQAWFHEKIWKPFLLSASITGVVYLAFTFLNERLWLHAFLAGGTYIIVYFFINKLLKTTGYTIFMKELKEISFINSFMKKIPCLKNL